MKKFTIFVLFLFLFFLGTSQVKACTCANVDQYVESSIKNAEVITYVLGSENEIGDSSSTFDYPSQLYLQTEIYKLKAPSHLYISDRLYDNTAKIYLSAKLDKYSCEFDCKQSLLNQINHEDWMNVRQTHILVLDRNQTNYDVMLDLPFNDRILAQNIGQFKQGETYEQVSSEIAFMKSGPAPQDEEFDLGYFIKRVVNELNTFFGKK